ncbi:MAG: glycosyltransferase family A protein [Betaproteobacteria bacterium]
MSATVDAVIPVHNAAAYLREAVASVLSQTLAVRRIIVVDDGSTDASADIARAYGPPVDVHGQARRGAASARNAGIARSDADFVAFLDADDRWRRGRIRAAMRQFDETPTLGYVVSRMQTFVSPELSDDAQRRLRAQNAPHADGWLTSALVVRRAALATVGGFDEVLRIGEAIDWFSRARAAGVAGDMHADVLVERRLHETNSTHADAGAAHAYLVVAKRHLDRLRAARGDDDR